MNPSTLSLLCAAALAAGAAFGADAPPTRDATAFVDPGAVRVGGVLGFRIEASLTGRLLTIPEDELLGGFQHRPGSQSWIGEHVGKWLHAATLTWAYTGNADLKAKLDRVGHALIATQEADGYLGTYDRAGRWTMRGDTGWDVWTHKYCLLGLLTYHRYTGDAAALAACRKAGDLLLRTFGAGPGQLDLMERSTHLGMASSSVLQPMVWLYRATGDVRYLDWCRYVVASWDTALAGPKLVTTLLAVGNVHRTANGKAYEMMSCLVGLVELARTLRERGEVQEARRMLDAASRGWDDIVAHRMYLTGGTSLGEVFQDDDFLPNIGSVSETCAQVTFLQLSLELLRLKGDAKYADVAERILFNHLLGAQKPSGDQWCYFTPLEGRKPYGGGMSCCLSSGPRGVALTPTWAYTRDGDGGLRVNLYAPGEVNLGPDGFHLTQETAYPYDGNVTLRVVRGPAGERPLRLRIPGWCQAATVAVGDGPAREVGARSGKYVTLLRRWQPRDTVTLKLQMPLRVVLGEHTNEGRLALMRGPLVLAVDARFLPADARPWSAVTVPVEDPAQLPLTLTPVAEDQRLWPGEVTFDTRGLLHVATGAKEFPLRLTDFAHAGARRTQFEVWLPRPGGPPVRVSPFMGAKESWSRVGNVEGSICNGDAGTWRVTFDGSRQDQDWYAVELDKPVTVQRFAFAHGVCYHDGGWFDASAGKPNLQIKRTPDAAWETVATLDSYPDTTATDARGLRQGQRFEAALPAPVQCVAIRIVGKPACGDNPAQAFSSCAELTAE